MTYLEVVCLLDEIRAGKILRFAQNDSYGVVILNEVKDLILKLSHYAPACREKHWAFARRH